MVFLFLLMLAVVTAIVAALLGGVAALPLIFIVASVAAGIALLIRRLGGRTIRGK